MAKGNHSKVSNQALQNHLKRRISQSITSDVIPRLAPLEMTHTFRGFHKWMHAMEEFINLCLHDSTDEEDELYRMLDLRQWHPLFNNLIDRTIIPRWGKKSADRFKRVVLLSAELLQTFAQSGRLLGYRTVIEAAVYYQLMRRHFLNVLYVTPHYCKGKVKLTDRELLLLLTTISNPHLIGITTQQRQLALAHVVKGVEFPSRIVSILDELHTEPERLSITDPFMDSALRKVSEQFVKEPNASFSVADFKNQVMVISSYHELFDFRDPYFDALKDVMFSLLNFVKDDYFIVITERQFNALLAGVELKYLNAIKDILVLDNSDFVRNSNSSHALIKIGTQYRSCLTLLSRCLYYYKNISLNANKKFQIKSGFLFEEQVKKVLISMGFKIVPNVKRIEHKEFDVIATRDRILYNFQCKNNFLDITLIELDPAMFARKNNTAIRAYRAAIRKEVQREHLLRKKNRSLQIEHYVISRFPVITEDPQIIIFNNLRERFS